MGGENVRGAPWSQAHCPPSLAQLGGCIGCGVPDTCSTVALALLGPPGTPSMACLHPDSGHRAATSMPEVTAWLAFNSLYLAIKGKVSEGIHSPDEPVISMQILNPSHLKKKNFGHITGHVGS